MAKDEHLQILKSGSLAWNQWREQHPEIRPDLSESDLQEFDFKGYNLFSANLYHCNFFRADFEGCDLRGAEVTGSNLRFASICGANLGRSSITDCAVDGIQYDPKAMRGLFRGIRGAESVYGDALFKRAVADQDFLDTLEFHWSRSWRRMLFWAWGTIDYGRSLSRVGGIATFLILFYGLMFRIWPQLLDYGGRYPTAFTPFYFSIVTYTTLGFGDIKPNSMTAEIIVSSEVIIGYMTLGLMLSVLANKLARRS